MDISSESLARRKTFIQFLVRMLPGALRPVLGYQHVAPSLSQSCEWEVVERDPRVTHALDVLSHHEGEMQSEFTIDSLPGIIASIEKLREILHVRSTRADPNFGPEYVETISANFQGCDDFGPERVYPHLGYTDDWFARLPVKRFQHLITQRIEETDNQKEKKLLRQFGFLFRNQECKNIFDAYILRGQAGLDELRIDPENSAALQKDMETIIEIKAGLADLQDEIKRASRAHEQCRNNDNLATSTGRRSRRTGSRRLCVIS